MKRFRYLSVAILLLALFFVGCSKDDLNLPGGDQAEVQFLISNETPDNAAKSKHQKSDEEIKCSDLLASYVKTVIDGNEIKIGAFYVMEDTLEALYTNSIMLPTSEYGVVHTVSDFKVWNDHGTTGDESDDVLISATPVTGSTFASYVQHPLNIDFTVETNKKTAVPIEVLCYEPQNEASFGFTYFGLTEVIVRNQNFFGDFCMKSRSEYDGSLYSQQSGWSGALGEYYDAPTIAKIEVLRKQDNGAWVSQGVFQNTLEGEQINVSYGDYKAVVDSFKFILNIYVKVGTSFEYKQFHVWKFRDAEMLDYMSDGNGKTTYYVLGSCHPEANYVFPGYMNLPLTATYKIVGSYAPGSLGGYVDAKLTNVASGFDFGNGTYASWCSDHDVNISVNTSYDMDVYSSLYVDLLPAFARSNQWAKINWLINHVGFAGSNDLYPGHTWADLQGAIWLLETPAWNGNAYGGVPSASAKAHQMAADANANFSGYEIPVGGWAAVIFVPHGTANDAANPTLQTMFIKVDP